MVPKCTSWRGHKFEPRYSETPPTILSLAAVLESVSRRLIEALTVQKYECDVCVRCGHVVQKPQS